MSRKSVWGGVALIAAALALSPAPPLAGTASGQSEVGGAWSFVSNPTLQAPAIEVMYDLAGPSAAAAGGTAGDSQPGYLLLAPIKNFNEPERFLGKPGPEILEADGNPIWEHPLGGPIKVGSKTYEMVAMNLHTATYEGQPVLVWWQGYITPQGFGNGFWAIVNQHYQTLAKINAPPGFELDFHEIQLTNHGTAFIIANRTEPLNLHCCGGPANGSLYDQVVFEVDIKTGRVLWGWDPLQHIPLRESYVPPPSTSPWDPYHINSLSFSSTGSLIISARNTSAAYWVHPYNGQIFAVLGGKHSTFKLGAGAHFAWQHDVEQQAGEQLSLFDDEAAPPEGKQSRGLWLRLNWEKHTATVLHEYLLPRPALAGSQGNLEHLSDGNVFVGWGQLPFLSEYTAAGSLQYIGKLPGPDESYRTYRSPWTGLPTTPPTAATQAAGGDTNVYASWNGATQVATWQLLAGSSPSSLAKVGQPVARQGFETLIATNSPGPYYAVRALDSSDRVLSTSSAVSAPPRAARKSANASSRR
jgi:Arylsulfotransferase (ASST)